MKIRFFAFLLCFFTFVVATHAGDNDDLAVVEKTAKEYFDKLKQKDAVGAVEYLHPKMFEMVPKETVIEMINASFENDDNEISFGDSTINKIAPIITDEKQNKYTLINYSLMLHMHSKTQTDSDEYILRMLKVYYGNENVQYDADKHIISIKVEDNAMYVIWSPEFNGWKLIEKKESAKTILEQIIPKEIMSKL